MEYFSALAYQVFYVQEAVPSQTICDVLGRDAESVANALLSTGLRAMTRLSKSGREVRKTKVFRFLATCWPPSDLFFCSWRYPPRGTASSASNMGGSLAHHSQGQLQG